MKRDFMDLFFEYLFPVFFVGMLLVTVIGAPAGVYLEGRAKSRWLKETKNMDVPWYEAIFLETHNQDVNLNVDLDK